MFNKQNIGNIEDIVREVARFSRAAQRGSNGAMMREAARARVLSQRAGKGEMIRDLARAAGDAGQRSGKGGTCGGGLGGQKAGGIKGGGKRKTHAGRKRSSS